MSKTIDSLVQSAIDGKSFAGVILCKMHFTPEQRYCNAYQSIYWDEGSGEEEYIGLGNLASLSVLGETAEVQAQTIQLTLSGIPNSAITDAFSTDYINKPVYLWYATLDTTTYAVQGGSSGPVLVFAGRMDFADIEFGETATITMNATSRLADWDRARGGRFNHTYQQRYIDSTDFGFEYVRAIQNKVVNWGGVDLADPGSTDGRGGTRDHFRK
jgi:hypothetical protein